MCQSACFLHWSEVRLKNGKQGLVLLRFMTTEKLCRLLLESLEKGCSSAVTVHSPYVQTNAGQLPALQTHAWL